MGDLSINKLRQLNAGLWKERTHKASNWPRRDFRKLSAVHVVRFKLAERHETLISARNAKVSNTAQIGKHLEWLWAQVLAEAEDSASLPTRIHRQNDAKPQLLKLWERFQQLHAVQHNKSRRSSSLLLERFHSEWRSRIPTRVPVIGIVQTSMLLGAALYTGSRKMTDSLLPPEGPKQ